MTQKEFESFLLEKLLEIRKVYNEYCPEDPYLTMCLNSDGNLIHANNTHWKDWCEHKVELYHFLEEEG